ncbi:MFS transporter [Solobacterium moorei]|uniref:Transporter, major facilitator family protein n=1 Tax=Solobacterium moorei F0204 TaxID=706433 RepID=E7MMC6_9FIRM|nr:MFS transporter [Solobacterium moorei]EFW24781.1 transporter, major facilitator family protein [Solobacterium moorei F0204]
MFIKLTKAEKDWILYDVGNSAFILLVSTVMPLYFNSLAEKDGLSSVSYLAYWGYAASAATLCVAFLGPVIGTITDFKGFKKPIFFVSVLAGSTLCFMMGFISHWLMFLIFFIIAKAVYSSSIIFYDSMLGDITTEERLDSVSSSGYAWGYIGSCIPFVLSLAVILGGKQIGISGSLAMTIAFTITAVWWFVFSLPLLKTYKQNHYIENTKNAIAESFKRLGNTLKNATKHKKIFLFLISFFFYIDGVYTIIDLATAYGTALGLSSTSLLLALLLTQIVAFPAALTFGRLAQKFDTTRLILLCIFAYLGIAIFAIFLDTQAEFWILAVCVGLFQGGIQALSRSYFTKIIPAEQSGEYFGLMDICGKGAAFLGTASVSLVSQITGSISAGVGSIAIFFVLGIFFFIKTIKTN